MKIMGVVEVLECDGMVETLESRVVRRVERGGILENQVWRSDWL